MTHVDLIEKLLRYGALWGGVFLATDLGRVGGGRYNPQERNRATR